MELGTFRNQLSTFTWIGRHASEMKFLLRTLHHAYSASNPELFTISKSGLETYTLAYFTPPDSRISAVGITPEVTTLLKRVQSGEAIDLSTLTTILCNRQPDDSAIPNTDFIDTDKLVQAGVELSLAGIDSPAFLSGNGYRVSPQHSRKLHIVDESLDSYLSANKGRFDFAYAGLVFQNLVKIAPREQVSELVGKVVQALKPEGVLGIGTTPFDLYGPKGTPALMEENGVLITDLLVDNLVQVGDKLLGGYCLRGAKGNAIYPYSSLGKGSIDSILAADPVLAIANVQYRALATDRLQEYLAMESDCLPIAASRHYDNQHCYHLWEAPRARLEKVVPPLRHTFGLIPGLNKIPKMVY